MKTAFLLGVMLLAVTAIGSARTWTSADGKKTIEADYISSTDTTVTVRINGRRKTVELTTLSEEDRAWIATQAKETKPQGASPDAFYETDFGKALKKTRILKGKRLKREKLEAIPKYFIIYLSASW